MKKKIIIAVIAVVVIAAAVGICMKLFGGSHTGIDNNPEAKISGDNKVLVAYFSWSGNGQQMARCISAQEALRDMESSLTKIWMTCRAETVPCWSQGRIRRRMPLTLCSGSRKRMESLTGSHRGAMGVPAGILNALS